MERRGPDPDRTNDIVLETERLLIDLPRDGDAEQLFALVGGSDRERICQNLVWDGPDRVEDIGVYHEQVRNRSFRDGGFSWMIRDRSGSLADQGAALGMISTRPGGPPGRADVGYWLGVPYWRQGVMTEALAAVVDLGFGELDYHKIEADVFTFNTAGRALVESLGFTLEGVARATHFKNGRWIDNAFYGLLHHEWEPRS